MKQRAADTKKSSPKVLSDNVRAAVQQSQRAGRKTTGVDKRIYDAVFGAVMSHRLPPGTKLTEASLCELFHVSRTIVRKALLRLAHEHILELRPNRGAIVASPTPRDTREIFAARRAIEAAIVPLVVKRAGKADIARLRQHVQDEHDALDKGERSVWIRLTGEFHLALAEVAANRVLMRYLTELVSQCSLIIALYDAPKSVPCEDGEHDGLINAIAKGDAALAVKMMDQHLLAIEARLRLEDEQDPINLAEILIST